MSSPAEGHPAGLRGCGMRKCGDCQLCCKLLPVRELNKQGNQRCQYQRTGKGCTVYNRPEMPGSCRLWNCRWLVDELTGDLRRPDRSGYVIDIMPDFVQVRNDLTLEFTNIPVLQIWVDPARPDAWRDDRDLKDYIDHMGATEGTAALIRNGEEQAIFVAPPSINPDHTWFESGSNVGGPTHTAQDILDAGFDMQMVMR